jgi:hypothetical protein
LFLGLVACSGHPCQKQPSTKTTNVARMKTMSPRHRSEESGR